MTVKEITGDLFSTDATMIGHGVNCKGAMRKGIAVEFSTRFPDMYDRYKDLCRKGNLKPGEVYIYESENWTIANIASQFRPGNDAKYEWSIRGLGTALEIASCFGHESLAIPRIGCGIGGLEWWKLREQLIMEFDDHEVDLLVYSL